MIRSAPQSVVHAPSPPRVPGPPLLGQALRLLGDPEAQLRQWYRDYGPIFRFNAAHIDYTCLAGPEANQFVNGEGRDCFESRTFWRSVVEEWQAPNAVIALDGQAHRIVRRELKPAFDRGHVDDNIAAVIDIVRRNFDAYAPGDAISMVFAGQKLASNIVGYLMMDAIPTDRELRDLFVYFDTMTVLLAVLRLPRALLNWRGPKLWRARRVAWDFAERAMAHALTVRRSRPLFVHTLLEAQAKHPELFSDTDVRLSGMFSFFAGIDTLGQTTTFMLWELLRNPSALARVQAEVDAVFGRAGVPTKDAIAEDLPLLRGAFMEALRLHPTGFGVVRTAAKGFEFAGHSVRCGQDILLYTTACHMDATYFPDPTAFDLDRYGPSRGEHTQKGVFAPFGRGPHKCAGASWAEAQALVSVGTLLHAYEFELPPAMREARVRMRTTPTLGHGFRLRLKRRR